MQLRVRSRSIATSEDGRNVDAIQQAIRQLSPSQLRDGWQQIETGRRSAGNLSIRSKIGWLARYFNEYAVSFGLPEIQPVE